MRCQVLCAIVYNPRLFHIYQLVIAFFFFPCWIINQLTSNQGIIFLQNAPSKRHISEGFSPLFFPILALCLLIYAQGDLTFCLAAGFLSGGGRKLKSLSAEGQLDSDRSVFAKSIAHYCLLMAINNVLGGWQITCKCTQTYQQYGVPFINYFRNTAWREMSALQHLLTSFPALSLTHHTTY